MESSKTNNMLRFNFLADNINYVITVHSLDGRHIYRNRSCIALFGDDQNKFREDPFYYIDLDDRLDVFKAFEQCAKKGKSFCIDYQAILSNGTICHMESRGEPILNEIGEIIEVILFTTEFKRKEENIDSVKISHINQLQKRYGELSALNKMAAQLYRCNSVVELKKVLKNDVKKLFVNSSGAMYLFHSDLNQFGEFLSWGTDRTMREKYFSKDQCWSVSSDNGIHLVEDPDPEEPFLCPHLGEIPYSYICIQMRGKGDINLILHLEISMELEKQSSDEEKRLSMHAQQEVAAAVARHSALAIENLSQKDGLRKAAELDELTGLFNRHYLTSTLKREVLRAARSKSILGVIMIDIDFFKKINDSYTHSGGDYALREVSKTIRQIIRETDIPCRYGGEEFILIMPDTTHNGLMERAEAIRLGVKELELEFHGRPMNLTVSIGVAMMAGHDVIAPDHVIRLPESAQFVAEDKAEKITQAADKALYQAKNQGRDQVVIWQYTKNHNFIV